MEVILTFLFFSSCALVGLFLVYQFIKMAVRNGIIEAHEKISGKDKLEADKGPKIAKKRCEECNKWYDMDSPKCPYCGKINIAI